MNNKFNITLFSTPHFDSFFNYQSSYLPLPGDMIEIEEEKTLFKISERSFNPAIEGEVILVTLHGIIEGDEVGSLLKFDRLRGRLDDVKQGIKRDSYGEVI